MKVGAGVVAGGVAIAGAFWLGRSMVDSPKTPAASQSQATATTGAPATATSSSNLVEFRDDKAGWAMSVPKDWSRLPPKDAAIALVVSEKPAEQNTGGSILARVITLGAPVTDANLAEAKAKITDAIVTGEGVQQLTQPAVIHQGGLPGYFYFYSFKDPGSGQQGVHSHYFLFKGSTMISFVFQALPKDDFQRLANLYDAVIGSFRVL
jgi:hypothetical protein